MLIFSFLTTVVLFSLLWQFLFTYSFPLFTLQYLSTLLIFLFSFNILIFHYGVGQAMSLSLSTIVYSVFFGLPAGLLSSAFLPSHIFLHTQSLGLWSSS